MIAVKWNTIYNCLTYVPLSNVVIKQTHGLLSRPQIGLRSPGKRLGKALECLANALHWASPAPRHSILHSLGLLPIPLAPHTLPHLHHPFMFQRSSALRLGKESMPLCSWAAWCNRRKSHYFLDGCIELWVRRKWQPLLRSCHMALEWSGLFCFLNVSSRQLQIIVELSGACIREAEHRSVFLGCMTQS